MDTIGRTLALWSVVVLCFLLSRGAANIQQQRHDRKQPSECRHARVLSRQYLLPRPEIIRRLRPLDQWTRRFQSGHPLVLLSTRRAVTAGKSPLEELLSLYGRKEGRRELAVCGGEMALGGGTSVAAVVTERRGSFKTEVSTWTGGGLLLCVSQTNFDYRNISCQAMKSVWACG